MTTNVEKTERDDPQDVYCVSVPSSYIIVRRNGKVAVTGNCQNWGDLFKHIVVAPPGYMIVAADYAALEQRIMGALTGGDLFTFVNRPDATTDEEKYDPDIDCHSHIARLVFGERFLHPEQYLHDILDPEAREKTAAKKKKAMRNHTKSVVYARNYGSGGETILKIVKKSNPQADKDEVDRVIQVYDRRFPELPRYRERMYRQVNDPACRELRSPLLRRRRKFPGRNPVPLTDASNFGIQSCAADIVNLRMLELAKRLPRDAAIIAQVHDSITVLCRDYDAHGVRDLMDEVLPCRYDLGHGSMLFDAKAKIGQAWDEV
jgi:DNA polymerase I-like protein with 3'-5' exonuclease and polymerase domains